MAPPNESKPTPEVATAPKLATTTGTASPASVPSLFSLEDGELTVGGGKATLLSGVPGSVTLTPFAAAFDPKTSDAPRDMVNQAMANAHRGAFLGFTVPAATDRAPCRVGRLARPRRFMSVFRFKTWWSTAWAGECGRDLQMETQWVLLEVPELAGAGAGYVLVLPLVQGSFRSAIFPDEDDGVVICAESGSKAVTATDFGRIAYVHGGDDPYRVMQEAYLAARVHLGTFRLIQEKALPPMADRFGWCTWDAFYLTVDPAGVWQGVSEFSNAGVPPRFLIIDDGWQSVNRDDDPPHEDAPGLVLGGDQMTSRLYRFDECARFRGYKEGSLLHRPPEQFYDKTMPKAVVRKAVEIENTAKAKKKAAQGGATDLSSFDARIAQLRREMEQLLVKRDAVLAKLCDDIGDGDGEVGLKAFLKDMRRRFPGLDDVYVWQALCGGWGGVRPGATPLDARIVPARLSPGLAGTMDDLAVDRIVEGGIGLVRPDQAGYLYESMHSYLAGAGVTGVKVDVVHTLEYVCEENGGRVALAKAYYDGLSKSIAKNFNGTGIIASMQQCNDFFFLGTRQVSMGRAGDDFWFSDPNGDPMGVYWLQGAHMVNCAYNSLWMGQFIRPDWDMFQSDHACAAFHAASRAISGGPVYVSDSLGGHDFALLRRLVFPDGTVARCLHYALPTRDCLFKNPLFDQQTALKIWNLNKFGGVIGAFNSQGAGWDPAEHRVRGYSHCYKPVSGDVRPADVEWGQREDTCAMANATEYAVYRCQSEELLLMTPNSEPIHFTLQPSSFELFTFAPVMAVPGAGARFAPIGLVDMMNCGGAVVDVVYSSGGEARMKVKGAGRLLVYSDVKPKRSLVDGCEAEFEWGNGGKLLVDVTWKKEKDGVSDVVFCY
ncbi:stachyose synthase [Phragmites australis]|uniref:stachyose synthase n=1 Tax=Phragmites australis TaxID=29695 RepID=UPI002D78E670|nr:stachyose synthase [Phragmites australis]